MLSSEGELDAAVEAAITRIVRKQRAAAAEAQLAKQREQAQNLRPVDVARDHVLGELNAPITLVEYSDFECPYCQRFHPHAEALVARNPGVVKWVYRHFPLTDLHPGARKLAEASECVAALDGNVKFWEYADLIYQITAEQGAGFAALNMREMAEQLGVDGVAFVGCLEGGIMAARVTEDFDDAGNLGMTGTPTSIIINQAGDTRLIRGSASVDEMQKLVNELL